jgi:ABC-type transport system substrate-binding protein
MFRNLMSPGEPTYMMTVNFTPNQFMSKVGSYSHPKIAELLRVVFAEDDPEKLKPVYAELLQLVADESPYVWIGFFNATNLWRERVKGFKPSRGLTVNVRDVTLT